MTKVTGIYFEDVIDVLFAVYLCCIDMIDHTGCLKIKGCDTVKRGA